MSNTNVKLIYVNKGQAKIKDETGQFLSEVPYGVKVNAGDEISVESIAVATSGTGANVIEIPSRVLNYEYKTNKIQLNCYNYINYNATFSVLLKNDFNTFYNSSSSTPVSNTDEKYGYATNAGIDTFNHIKDLKYDGPESYSQSNLGQRFYLGCWAKGNDYHNPEPSDVNLTGLFPSKQVFQLMQSNITCAVNLGYDSPANIAKTITGQIHASNVVPNYQKLGLPLNDAGIGEDLKSLRNYSVKAYSDTQFNPGYPVDLMPQLTYPQGAVQMTYALPRPLDNNIPVKTPGKYWNLYSSPLGTNNPFYHFYGSRLLCDGTANPEGTIKKNQYLQEVSSRIPLQWAIYNINPVPSVFPENYVMATNLPYNELCLRNIQGFIHSQKYYDKTPLTTEELYDKSNLNKWFTNIKIGRYDDSFEAIPPVLLPNVIAGSAGVRPNVKLQMYTYYNDKAYNNAIINTPALEISEDEETYLGNLLTPNQIAKVLNLNVVKIKAVAPSGGIEYVVGFIIKERYHPQVYGNPLIVVGNDVLVDFGFNNYDAMMIQIISNQEKLGGVQSKREDYLSYINVGAPEMALTFDDQRGKFSLEYLYWANYVFNDSSSSPEANASAGTECISINSTTYASYLNGQEFIPIRYAQSGIGIYNISVFDSDNNAVPIDWYDDDDIDSKFTKSLWYRLGFRYKSFINKFGMSNIIQQEQYYNTTIQTENVDLFTYPLTNNPRFDSTLNPSLPHYKNFLPAYNLALVGDIRDLNIACETNQIVATAPPSKLATPMWLIESDIIEGVKYVVDGRPRNVLAIVNRAYGSSDFVFSFATDYKFVATKSFVITHIKSNILTSDLINADVDDETTIIYKIEGKNQMLENLELENEIENQGIKKKK